MKVNSTVWMVLLAVVVFGAVIGAAIYQKQAPTELDKFAQCITEKGGKMFGSYWCENCANQKEMFGTAFQYINYTECSSPGSKIFDLCPEVTGVPLWTTVDGQSFEGARPLDELANIFSCPLPENL